MPGALTWDPDRNGGPQTTWRGQANADALGVTSVPGDGKWYTAPRHAGLYPRRPLVDQVVPLGSAAINDVSVPTGATRTFVASDASVVFNGRPTTKVSVTAAGTGVSLEIGTSAATVNLAGQAAALPARAMMVAAKIAPSMGVPTKATIFVGDATYAALDVYEATHVETVGEWMYFSTPLGVPSSVTGSVNYGAAVRVKVRLTFPSAVQVGDCWVSSAYALPQPQPTVVWTNDDGYTEWTWLAAEAAKRGIPLSFSVASDLIGSSAFFWTEAEMLAVANHPSGLFDINNHARVNTSYAVDGLVNYRAAVNYCRDWLVARGIPRESASCHAYVQGSHDDAIASALRADGFSGARIVGTAGRGAANIMSAIAGADSLMSRKVPAVCNLEDTQPLSTVQGHINAAVKTGTAFIMGHRFLAAPATITYVAGYHPTHGVLDLMDWLAERRDVDGWRLLKFSEWAAEVARGDLAPAA